MMLNEMTTANTVAQQYTVFNPIFEGFSNERLYEALCAATAPLNEGLEELQLRLRPIIIGASKAYLTAFSWTLDDAMTEALIHIWDLVRKHSYKAGKVPFHSFFRATWMNFLNGLFQKTVLKNPIMSGNVQIGWCDHEPVFVCGYAFHEKAAEYRKKKAISQAKYIDRKLAEQGKTRQPRKPPMTEEERREKSRIKAAERFASLTPEEKALKYARDNERRRLARANETPEQKEARRARYRGYAAARKARLASI